MLARGTFARAHNLATGVYRQWFRNGLVLRRLERCDEGRLRALGRALAQTLEDDWNEDERAWQLEIEALRSQLERASERVRFPDFGSGSLASAERPPDAPGARVERSVGEICRSSACRPWKARLLFRLVRGLRPRLGLELGTNLGLSAAYQAAALECNGDGRLVTLEGAPPLAALAQRHLELLGLAHRVSGIAARFDDALDGVLAANGPFDYAFIDGHHDELATADYFERILRHSKEGALLVFDDIRWSPGMRRAWARIRRARGLAASVDLVQVGLALVGPTDAAGPLQFDLALPHRSG